MQHPQLAMFLRNLGNLCWIQGKYSEAESYIIQALTMYEANLGPKHWVVSSAKHMLAALYREQGRYNEAESLLLRVISINDETYAPDYFASSFVLEELADLYLEMGRNTEAESYYVKALKIREKAHPNHNLIAETLEQLSKLRRTEGNKSEAMELAGRACRIRLKNLYDLVRLSSEKDALTFSRNSKNSVNNYLTCFLDCQPLNGALTEEAANLIFNSKGLISDIIFERQMDIVLDTDSATLALAESFTTIKSQLSKLFIKGPDEDLQEYRMELDSLEGLAIQLEANLSRRSASFKQHRDSKNINVNRLASFLSNNDILVEYLKYEYYKVKPDSSIPRYLAVLLTNEADPIIVDLGDATEIDARINRYRKHVTYILTAGSIATAGDLEDYTEISRELYKLIWQPLEKYIIDKELVLIAPDGMLNTISFAGLLGSDGSYLIENFALHYLSAGRDLVRFCNPLNKGIGLFAMGNPDYDASVLDRLLNITKQEDAIPKTEYGANRNIRDNCGDIRDIDLSPLPGTKTEINNIAAIWESTTDEPAFICLDVNATEDMFKAEAPGKRVIHLATHGYFLEKDCEPDTAESTYESGDKWTNENPLLHSGLFFAGANKHGDGADSAGIDDGILTAYEVSAMHLRGTELVVLSACETGLGQIQSGEGVYGLRRAFQMAGAENVISTLWPVNDKAITEIASKLYDRKGISLPETIRQIQIEKINELRRQGGNDHPVSWAALVAYGNWH